MDELLNLWDSNSSPIKMKNDDGIYNVNEEDNCSDEEGEIKETYNIKDLDFGDLENPFESNGFESQIDYIDVLLNTHEDVKPDFSNFDHSMFDNIECDESTELTDIDARYFVKSELLAAADVGKERTRNNYLMRPVRNVIVSDTETDDDNSDSTEEIDLPASGSILDSILLASSRSKTKSHGEKKGRIVDKEAELEYLLPTDLEEKLSRIVISSNTALEAVGTFVQRIEGTQTITVKAARSDPILDLNTIVLGKDKRMIGMIDNIFGIKKEPMYLVVCKSQSIASSFQGGEQLFCAPFVENAYFTAIDTPDNRCDLDNNSDFAFSDDEKEENFKRAMNGQEPSQGNKKKKKVNRKRKPGSNQFEKRPNYQSNNHQNPKFAGQKNPFRAVNTQPFINQSPSLPYWTASSMTTMAPPISAALNPPPQYNHNNNNTNQYSFTNFPPPPMMPMMPMMMMMNNPNQCTSYAQFQKFNQFHNSNRQ